MVPLIAFTPENLVLTTFVALTLVATLFVYLFFARYRQHRAADLRWFRLVLGNLLVLLLLLSTLALMGEIYFRFWYDTTDANGLTLTHQRWLKRHLVANNQGFRDNHDYSLQRQTGKRRVTFIGDSFTAGHGIADVEDRFANLVGQLRPAWEIHVLAGLGWDTPHHLNLVRTLPDAYELEHVVLVYCLNDIELQMPERPEIMRKIYASTKPTNYFTQHSYLFNTLHYRWVGAMDPGYGDYYTFNRKAYETETWNTQVELLRAFHDGVTMRGGKLSVITFPFLHLMGPDYQYHEIHGQLDEFWKGLGIAHLDLLPVFEDLSPDEVTVNAFDGHPNERAHWLAARAIVKFLDQQLHD